MTTIRLDELLSPAEAAEFINHRVHRLVRDDMLDVNLAHRLVCERAAAGDPLALAHPGQTWTTRLDAGDGPGQRLTILRRMTCPPRIIAEDEHGNRDELPIGVLNDYTLTHWRWHNPPRTRG